MPVLNRVVVLIACAAFALIPVRPGLSAPDVAKLALTPPQIEKVSSLHSYFFAVRSYAPPLPVGKDSVRQAPDPSTPEHAALVHFSGMLLGDYKGWLDSWDASSRARIEARNHKLGREADFWTGHWNEVLSQYSSFHLTRRIDSGDNVFVEFRASGAQGQVEDYFVDVPLTKGADGHWRATQELGSDPVFLNWRRPGTTTEIMEQGPPDL